ncbi:MAG: hypothetical protein RCG15_08565 [Candidatus Rickettsia vulgarisii]
MVRLFSKFNIYYLFIAILIFLVAVKIFPINKNYILGIDVGGTKIEAQLFEVENGILAQKPSWEIKQTAQKG